MGGSQAGAPRSDPDNRAGDRRARRRLPSLPAAQPASKILSTERALLIVAACALVIASQDGWIFLQNLRRFGTLAAPDCLVMDRGVITYETCEHFLARVGEDDLITDNT